MSQRIDPAQSRFKNYLPACVKYEHYRPANNQDPFDHDAGCAVFADIPAKYLLTDEACGKLRVVGSKVRMDIGERPLTMLERWALDDDAYEKHASSAED